MAEPQPVTTNSDEGLPLTGTLAGRFLITARLGGGGMGEVYRAEDNRLKRTVALKRLAPSLRADPVYRRRFQQESERVSRFIDPHIAAVYDVLEEQSEIFLVMEYIEGENLRQRLRRPMTLEQFFEIALQCAEALSAAHERGIVHCDIKPENIMLTTAGQVKILDFGVAKHLPRSDQSSTVDRAGAVGGTPAYMSPEVLLERVPDGRADIFSLGVVFYEMLTGHHPFLASSFVVTTDRIRHETPAAIRIFNRNVPETLEAAVMKMLAKDPVQRYSSAKELLQDLQAIHTGVTPSKLLGILARPRKVLSRWRGGWTALTVVIVAVLLAIVVYRQIPKASRPFGEPSPPVQLAVLPFSSTGNSPGAKAFCDGLTDTLTARLTKLAGNRPLQVVPASEVRAENVNSVEQARKDFGVGMVLAGSLHESGGQVRVTYSLVDARTRRQLHADTIDANLADPFAVEDQVVSGVLAMLGLEIQPDERVVLAARGTHDPSAYEQYLRGRGYLLDYHKPENIDSAIASFNRALTLDPKYPQAYAGLGEAYWQSYAEGQHGKDWIDKARSACEQAVSAAPQLAEGHICLGRVYRGTGEYEKAAAEFQKATSLDPTSDDAYRGLAGAYEKLNKPVDAEATYRQAIRLRPQYWAGYSWLGNFYFQQGRFDDAIRMFQQVIALAPDNFRGYSNLGAMYLIEGRYPEGIGALEKSLAIRPTAGAYDNLGNAYFAKRNFDAAARNFEAALKFDNTNWLTWGNLGDAYYWTAGKTQEASNAYAQAIRLADDELRVNPRDGRVLAYRATYLAMVGRKDQSLASLQKAISISPHDPEVQFRAALVYNHLGDTTQTLEWLRKALASGVHSNSVRDTADFDHLRDDARLQQLLKGH
jgi:serine/threonine protein kinase/tetratricopeptide (TPR) repeat protein